MTGTFVLYRFVANNTTPDDRTGTATFRVPGVDGLPPQELVLPGLDLQVAADINRFVQHAYAAGEAHGYHACKSRILQVL